MKYTAEIREVHIRKVLIEAGSAEEAAGKVCDGDYEIEDITQFDEILSFDDGIKIIAAPNAEMAEDGDGLNRIIGD